MLLMQGSPARWLVVLLGLSSGACSFLIDAPDARYAAATDAGTDAARALDADMDSAVIENDAETLDDAAVDADTPIDSSTLDAESCTSHSQCVAPIGACRIGALCNGATATCEDTMASDCTPCGEPDSVCVLGACRAKGAIYAYDFEGQELGDEWSGSPARPWTLTNDDHRDGVSQVAVSPMLIPGDGSNLELRIRDVPKDARISFWMRVSSQIGSGRLAFYIRRSSTVLDETQWRDELSGHYEWQQRDYDVRTDGDVTFTWRFVTKPGDITAGENRAFIDDVLIERLCD
jgi:hypothetical protein